MDKALFRIIIDLMVLQTNLLAKLLVSILHAVVDDDEYDEMYEGEVNNLNGYWESGVKEAREDLRQL